MAQATGTELIGCDILRRKLTDVSDKKGGNMSTDTKSENKKQTKQNLTTQQVQSNLETAVVVLGELIYKLHSQLDSQADELKRLKKLTEPHSDTELT